MNGDHFRYYIVLQPERTLSGSATLQRQTRRAASFEFVTLLKEWIAENHQQEQVSALDVTMFGQIQITCDAEFIDQIRQQDIWAIAEIRPAQSAELSLRRIIDQVSG
jgi:uncharacterized protein YjcR